MTKRTKGWLIAATSLILIGSILFVGVMSKMNWDLNKGRYETTTHTVTEKISHISVNVKAADVIFAPSTDGAVSVVCYENVHVRHTVTVEGDTLVIQSVDTRKWHQRLYVFSGSPKVTVYLPAATYGELKIHATTGDVTVSKGLTFDSADVRVTTGDVVFSANVAGDLMAKVTTGDIKLSDVTCRNLTATGTTGDIALRHVIATESFSIKRSTGDVTFDACDAASLTVKTTTGSITGTLLTPKAFDAHATTGRVEVPQTTEGGSCTLHTTTGSIKISLK